MEKYFLNIKVEEIKKENLYIWLYKNYVKFLKVEKYYRLIKLKVK